MTPATASSISSFCLTMSWSIMVRYSSPGGQLRGTICSPTGAIQASPSSPVTGAPNPWPGG